MVRADHVVTLLQYKGLAELQDKYKRKGFEVLAFPCNQFGSQEPGKYWLGHACKQRTSGCY